MSKRIKVGVFVVGGIALFCVGLFLIGSRQHLFGQYFVVYTEFNNIDTIQTGAKVRVSGMDAGEVTAIEIPTQPSGQFRLKLKVDKKLHPVIRQDSLASIDTEGMVGNKFVSIKKGTDHSPQCPAGCTLPGQESVSMGALMRQGGDLAKSLQSTVDDVHRRANDAIHNITSLSGHADGLIVRASPHIKQMTSNADALVAGIRSGRGTAGKLLTDPTVASNVDATIANARQTSANLNQASSSTNTMISDIQRKDLPEVNKTIENTKDMSQQLNQAVGTFLSDGSNNESTAIALRGAAHGAQQATTNLADDTEAIKHNFFLRGFFNRRGFYNLGTMNPSQYASSEFVKKPRARIWIPAAGLFNVRPDGSLELSATGRSILDQNMSVLVSYLPNNPMMIEGYCISGLPDQRYLTSTQRATVVRQYLISRFHLDPRRVGIMPQGGHPSAGTGQRMWDGISLVLIVSKH